MRKSIRAALFACAALSTLAFASSALAAYTSPKLVVASLTPQAAGSGGAVRVGVTVENSEDPTARVQILIPAGYQIGTPAAGTKLGDVTATAAAADLGGAILPLTGELQAVAPNTTGAAQCGVAASQYWNLHLTAAGQTLDIPLYVVAANANETAAGYQAKLVVCLPPPDVPAGTPGRATFGAKLLSATFTSSAITEATTAGDYRWTSLWTPYNPGQGTPNPAGSVEAQSLRHLPVKLTTAVARKKVTVTQTKTIKVKGKKKKVKVKVTVTAVGVASGVSENGKAPASATYVTLLGRKKIGTTKGSFVIVGKKTVKVTVAASIDSDTGSVPTGSTA